jgi:hypothetical protein
LQRSGQPGLLLRLRATGYWLLATGYWLLCCRGVGGKAAIHGTIQIHQGCQQGGLGGPKLAQWRTSLAANPQLDAITDRGDPGWSKRAADTKPRIDISWEVTPDIP